MNRRSIDLLVGMFVLLGIAALAFLAFRAASSNVLRGAETYSVHAYFDNIGGLKVKAPVRSAGVVVGRVNSIDLDTRRYQAEVVVEMDKRYPFPKDSSLKILTAGLLGDQFLGIEAGADEKNLKDGDKITMTQSAVLLENLIGQFLYGKASEGGDGDGGADKGSADKGGAGKGGAGGAGGAGAGGAGAGGAGAGDPGKGGAAPAAKD